MPKNPARPSGKVQYRCIPFSADFLSLSHQQRRARDELALGLKVLWRAC